jgi:hypothetical protein
LARQGDLELANAMRNAKPIQQPWNVFSKLEESKW